MRIVHIKHHVAIEFYHYIYIYTNSITSFYNNSILSFHNIAFITCISLHYSNRNILIYHYIICYVKSIRSTSFYIFNCYHIIIAIWSPCLLVTAPHGTVPPQKSPRFTVVQAEASSKVGVLVGPWDFYGTSSTKIIIPSGYVKIAIGHGPLSFVDLPINSMVIIPSFCMFTRG